MADIDLLDKGDTYSMALLMLYAASDIPEYSTLSELVYILDHDSFMKMIKYFSGQTIKIPTQEEITESLRLLMLFQYSKIEKLDWHEALKRSGFSSDESISARTKLGMLCNRLKKNNYRLGGLLGDRK